MLTPPIVHEESENENSNSCHEKGQMEDVVDKNQIFETTTENNNPDTRIINKTGL